MWMCLFIRVEDTGENLWKHKHSEQIPAYLSLKWKQKFLKWENSLIESSPAWFIYMMCVRFLLTVGEAAALCQVVPGEGEASPFPVPSWRGPRTCHVCKDPDRARGIALSQTFHRSYTMQFITKYAKFNTQQHHHVAAYYHSCKIVFLQNIAQLCKKIFVN
jgi:hypothetical protein